MTSQGRAEASLAVVQTFFADDVHGNPQPPRGVDRMLPSALAKEESATAMVTPGYVARKLALPILKGCGEKHSKRPISPSSSIVTSHNNATPGWK
jgi:hypothetical protein